MVVDRIREGVQKSIRPAPSTLALAHLGPPVPAAGPPMGGGPPSGPPQPFYSPSGPGGGPGAGGPPPPDNAIRTEYRMLVPDARVGGLIGKEGVVSQTRVSDPWPPLPSAHRPSDGHLDAH